MTMENQRKEKYEAPETKHVRVEVESGICATSVTPKPGDDVSKDRHVDINKQIDGGTIDFTTGENSGWE